MTTVSSDSQNEEEEIDSWEQIAEDNTIRPVGTKGAVTNEDTSSTNIVQQQESERHLTSDTDKPVSTSSTPNTEKHHKVKDETTPAKVLSTKTVVAPPRKSDEKENVNIVFIGHVGVLVYM